MLNYKLYALGGFTPAAVAPDTIIPVQGAPSSSLSPGGPLYEGHQPLPSSYQHLEFHIRVKRILLCQILHISKKSSLRNYQNVADNHIQVEPDQINQNKNYQSV
jgi:hypothetical protein